MTLFSRKDPLQEFILNHLSDMSLRQYLEHPQFDEFRRDIATKPDALAAKQYYEATNASMAECLLAVRLARALFSKA